MSLVPGTRLGPYEVLAPIGAGGMGEVFRARDTKLGRDVALKVLSAVFTEDPGRISRFRREAQVLASLNHPNIAAIYGLEEADGVVALVLELVEGEDLAQRLRRGAIPADEAVAIAKQMADGLEEAHEHGIVHRDLKPANVKLTADGKVKLLDFGLAKALEDDAGTKSGSGDLSHSPTMSRHMTEAGMILGTAAYMSPEQARGKPVDKRSDIWAFGVVLHEMLTGTRLFAGETVSDVLAAVLTRDIDLDGPTSPIRGRVRSLLRQCLVRDPKRRLRDIGDARIALERDPLDDAPAPAAPPERPRRPLSWAAAATIALLASAAGLVVGRTTVPAPAVPVYTASTFVPQSIFNARFMPDGRTIVLSSALIGNEPSLFESRADNPAPRPFGPPRTHLLSVSKSGELAVLTRTEYLNHRLFRGTLSRMTLDGAPRAVAEDIREADWLPDGSELAVVREIPDGDQLEFPLGHVVHRTQGYLSDPRVSRDGKRLAFMEHPQKFDDRGWVKVVDRAGTVTTLAGEFGATQTLTWSLDDRSVLFNAARETEDYKTYTAAADGSTPPVSILTAAGALYVHDLAADGTLAVTREDLRFGVVARGAAQSEERDLTPLDLAWFARLSGDGRFLAFNTGRSGPEYGLDMRATDGSPPARLGEGTVGGLSGDGRWVSSSLPSNGHCLVYPTGAGAVVPVPMGPLQTCQQALFFPDTKSLLITGNEPGKATRGYRASFPGGTPQALLPEGLTPAAISASGRRVLAQDATRAWQVLEIGGPSTPAKGLLPEDLLVEWLPDEATAIAADTRPVPAVLFRVRLDTGERTRIGELGPDDRAGLVLVRPTAYRDEGRQYAYDFKRRSSVLYRVSTSR